MSGPPAELLAYSIDPETLHEVPQQPELLARWLEDALEWPEPEDRVMAYRQHTWIGQAARMMRRLDVAEQHLTAALRLAEGHGSPQSVLLARIRLAHVHQWQGRFRQATTEFERCLREGRQELSGENYAFVLQHAGKAYYEAGHWTRARELFAEALRWRTEHGVDRKLVDSSRLALDGADACVVAENVATVLDRLVAQATERAGGRAADLVAEHGLSGRQRTVLSVLRPLLLAGPVPVDLATGVLDAGEEELVPRTGARLAEELAAGLVPGAVGWASAEEDLHGALSDLVATGWLQEQEGWLRAEERCRRLLVELTTLLDRVAGELWAASGRVPVLLDLTGEVIDLAVGTAPGRGFGAVVTALSATDTGPAGRLLDRFEALRLYRAEARQAARDIGRRAQDTGTAWMLVSAATGRVAARPYRLLGAERRAVLLAELRALLGHPA